MLTRVCPPVCKQIIIMLRFTTLALALFGGALAEEKSEEKVNNRSPRPRATRPALARAARSCLWSVGDVAAWARSVPPFCGRAHDTPPHPHFI